MMYFAPQHSILRVMQADPSIWGLITTQRRGARDSFPDYRWIADNGCFTGKWSENLWLNWLDKMLPYRNRCILITLPDVVGDALETLKLFQHYLPIVRSKGYPVALVAQDGLEHLMWPLEYDVLFVGGSTSWKLSEGADKCILRAKEEGKWVHVGRVNSAKRINYFKSRQVDSVDGTTICFSPTSRFQSLNKALV